MEKITVTDSRMHSLVYLYDMHTGFFPNVLEQVSDTNAHDRLNTKANHMAWIAGSLVYERFSLAVILGKKEILNNTTASYHLFKDRQGIQETATYPGLNDLKQDWKIVTPVLRNLLCDISTEKLDGPDLYEMPGQESTFYDTLSFMIDRESYCIGQLGLYRRLLGYQAMKYS